MMGRRVYLAAVLCAALQCSLVFPASKPAAKDLYDRAVAMEEKLKAPGSRTPSLASWKQTVDAFRRVYYTYPSSSYCDNALYQVAALYAEMGARFQDPLYYHRACSTYQFLIDQYASSPLVVDAMTDYIRIAGEELHQDADAEAMYARLKTRAPKVAASIRREKKRAAAAAARPAEEQSRPAADAARPAAGGPREPAADNGLVTLTSVRHYEAVDYTRVVLDFDGEASFVYNRLSDPDRLYFDFDNTVAARELLSNSFTVDDGFLKQIRVGQYTLRKTRVVLDLKSIKTFEAFALYHPYRLVVDIQGNKQALAQPAAPPPVREAQTEPETRQTSPETAAAASLSTQRPALSTAEPPEMASANANGEYSLARQLGLKVRRIVIDAGHGGHDPGAMQNGLREKDITLDVAKKLKTILQDDYGFEVLMTREDDRFVPLEERTAFANGKGADLFLSIHVNSSRNRKLKGVETYYLNFATTPEAMEVAARENAIAEKNMGELQKLTSAIMLNTKIEESREFAGLIQTSMISRLRKPYAVSNLGVKHAPFYVLIGAQMPSILAEISFMSNDKESGLLAQPDYRQTLAKALAEGVRNYIGTLAVDRYTRNLPSAR